MRHRALLVTLKFALPGLHGYREPLAVLIAIFLAFQQHIFIVLGSVGVVIGMFVPVNIQREVVLPRCAAKVPLATHRCRGIVIAQVVGIDIATGVRAVPWTMDVFDVVGAIGIEFQALNGLIGDVFR